MTDIVISRYYLMPSMQFFCLQITPAFAKHWQHQPSLPQLIISITLILVTHCEQKQIAADKRRINDLGVCCFILVLVGNALCVSSGILHEVIVAISKY